MLLPREGRPKPNSGIPFTKSPKKKGKTQRAKRTAKNRRENVKEHKEKFPDTDYCPACNRPDPILYWHHILSRGHFGSVPDGLIDWRKWSFRGCGHRACGNFYDEDPITGQRRNSGEKILIIWLRKGFDMAMEAVHIYREFGPVIKLPPVEKAAKLIRPAISRENCDPISRSQNLREYSSLINAMKGVA